MSLGDEGQAFGLGLVFILWPTGPSLGVGFKTRLWDTIFYWVWGLLVINCYSGTVFEIVVI